MKKLWNDPDAIPFKEPVDSLKYPDYNQEINAPIDLQIISEDLQVRSYSNPVEFSKDVQRVFSNSKKYNTDENSAVSF